MSVNLDKKTSKGSMILKFYRIPVKHKTNN